MFNWIQNIADWFVYNLLNLNKEQHIAEALNFFIYDTIKILILLFVVIFFMGIVNSYFPIDKVKNYLSRNKLFGLQYLMASLFGVVTPFCSCSSVPLFIGFVRGGIPLGVTFAFLITSPLVNEVAIGLFMGLFGVKTAIIYVISGVLLGTISGVILQKLKLESYLTPWVKDVLAHAQRDQDVFQAEKQTFKQRLPIIWAEVVKVIKGIIPYVLVGIAIGGLMHGYIPEGFSKIYG
ncbi:transporter [Algibacter lectus]|uniref:Transporter n=1 Tax=Algibacter lectus TaxID=221126 RepID=A0A090WR16_9FLAO|nr:transporter [Algibacter lectus]